MPPERHDSPWPFNTSTAMELEALVATEPTGRDTLDTLLRPLAKLAQVDTSHQTPHYGAELHHVVDQGLAACAIVHDLFGHTMTYTECFASEYNRTHAKDGTPLSDDGLPNEPWMYLMPPLGLEVVGTAATAVERAAELLHHPDYQSVWDNTHLLREHTLAVHQMRDRFNTLTASPFKETTG